MNKHSDSTSEHPAIKVKRQPNRRRTLAGGILVAFMTFFATVAMMLLFALIFAPQLSNALWGTNATQNALYGTSAAVYNAQIIVDQTSTALARLSSEQQATLALLSAREADINATQAAISAAIIATQTSEVRLNEAQRTQAALNYSSTQSAINQQATLIGVQATLTQQALEQRPQAIATESSNYSFSLREDIVLSKHPNQACNWQGFGGQVLNMESKATGANLLQVHVFNGDMDLTTRVGTDPSFGLDSGWSLKVAEAINGERYFVRLETVNGEQLSPLMDVIFTGNCEQNLAMVNFQQILPLGS